LEELYGNDAEKEVDDKEFEPNPKIKTREHETFLRKLYDAQTLFACCRHARERTHIRGVQLDAMANFYKNNEQKRKTLF
jgi:transcription initiation factor IIE alpha subunit